MPTKLLDLSDLTEDRLEVVLPIRGENGEVSNKKFTINDPSVATVMVAEKLKQELDAHEKSAGERTISQHKEFLQQQVYEILRIDNEITMEQVKHLPLKALMRLNTWMTEYINSIFLEDSPKNSTSEPSKTSEGQEENTSQTAS